VPSSLLRSKRAVASAVVATLAGVSAVVLLSGQSTPAHAAAAPGSTVRASVGNGTPPPQSPRGGSESELSSDGTAVVFSSYAQLDDSVKTGDQRNVYLRDLRNNRTVLISRGQFTRTKPEPPPASEPPASEPPASEPPASEPPASEPPASEPPTFEPPRVAGKPMLALNGAQPTLEFGEVAASGSSSQPTVSENGRYVAFVTSADNIVPEDDDTDQDILVCDRDPDGDGTFDEQREGGGLDYRYFRVNVPQWYEYGEGRYRSDYPSFPKLSDDASRIVWEDYHDTGGEGGYLNVVRTALLRPEAGGVLGSAAAPGSAVEIVQTPLDDRNPTAQYWADVSSDGRFVVLVADYLRYEESGEFSVSIPFHAVIRKDMATGDVLRVDWDVNTTPDHVEYLSSDESVNLTSPAISSNGEEIAFEAEEFTNSCSEGVCWNPGPRQPMVFVVRIAPDGTPVDSIVASRDNDNEIVNGAMPALSGDGRFVAFATDNKNAHDGIDIPIGEGSSCLTYRSDLTGGKLINLSGLPPTSDARAERVVCQVVVRDLVTDRERLRAEDPRLPGTLVSAGTGTDCAETVPDGATCGGNGDSPPYTRNPPSLSRNGSTVAFDSDATNLVADERDTNERTDVFVRTFRPELRADPTPLDFGTVEIGDTFDRVVAFEHVGTGPLVVNEIVVEDSDEFAVGAQTCSGPATVLQQASRCEVSVTFAPTTAGDRTGTLRLTLRDGRQFTVPLRGTGSRKVVVIPEGPRFAAGPDPLNFGDRLLLSDGPTQTVTVTNVGGSPLAVTGVAVVSAAAPDDYAVVADTCTGTPVAAGGPCQGTVAFSPKASGDRPAVLRFTDDAPGAGAHLIGLAGKGSTPTVIVSPGVTQPGRAVTVAGTGFSPNLPLTITLTGSVEIAKATANATGDFTATLLVLPKSSIGSRPVVATLDGTGLKAQTPLLIVSPTVTPSDFVVRG
jgi:hypothetical protein